MNTKKIFFSILLMLGSSFSLAAGWNNAGKLEGVYVDLRDGNQRILFSHESKTNPGNQCTSGSDYYELQNVSDSDLTNQAYALLLSLNATGKRVRVYLDGCGDTGWPLARIVDSINVGQ